MTGPGDDLSAEASAGAHASADDPTARPLLRVVRGEPTPEELAALVAVVAARATGAAAEEAPPRALSAWTERRQAMRFPLAIAPGAWVASGFRQGTRTRAGW